MSSSGTALSPPKPQKRRLGILAVLIKIGPKLLSVLGKLLKVLKGGKLIMAGASFAAYAMLFSWQFALVLIGSLVVHEYGHLWAMKRYKLKTKGIYLIPLLGAAAVSEDQFPTRKSEVVIALMGPLWGFALALATFCLYLATGSVIVAALSSWMAMVNLFNLLPINPLDGGRVMKSVAYSISSRLGLLFLVLGLTGCFALAWVFNFGLITFLLIIGSMDLLMEVTEMRKERDRRAILKALAGLHRVKPEADVVIGALQASLDEAVRLDENADRAEEKRQVMARYAESMSTSGRNRNTEAIASMPCKTFLRSLYVTVARENRRTYRRLISKEPYHVSHFFLDDDRPIKDTLLGKFLLGSAKPAMTPRESALAFIAYAVLAVALAGLMFAASHVPAAGAAMQLFVS